MDRGRCVAEKKHMSSVLCAAKTSILSEVKMPSFAHEQPELDTVTNGSFILSNEFIITFTAAMFRALGWRARQRHFLLKCSKHDCDCGRIWRVKDHNVLMTTTMSVLARFIHINRSDNDCEGVKFCFKQCLLPKK